MIKKASLFSWILIALCSQSSFSQSLYDINTIQTIEITFQESNWDQLLDNLVAAGNEERLTGTVTINGVEFTGVGVRYKGNSTYNANQVKNPLNIKLDYTINGQGYEGYGTLKLANAFKDPSFVRETMGYEIARKYMAAPLSNYAKVYINGTYIGLYTNDQDVDKFFMKTHFACNDNIWVKGEISEGIPPGEMGGVWEYFGADSIDYYSLYAIESDSGWYKPVQFVDTLNNHNTNLENVLNIDRHLWFLAFQNLLVNLDGPINNPQNHYLFEDIDKRFNPIPWDLNECFGGFTLLQSQGPLNLIQMQQLSPYVNSTDAEYPVLSKVLDNTTYKKMYSAHMKTIIEENFFTGLYEERALEIQAIIDAEVLADPHKFYTYSDFINNINTSVGTQGPPPNSLIVGITQLMDARMDYIMSLSQFTAQAPELSNPVSGPEQANPGDEVSFQVTANYETSVFLAYRFDHFSKYQVLEMYDDGVHNDENSGDGIYGNSIVSESPAIEYYFYALNNDAAVFLPQRASYEYYTLSLAGEVVINEFMADNEATISDQDGEYDDWIELYNNGTQQISLSGYYLSDDAGEPDKWQFPDTVISAGEYLLIWADGDTLQQGLHTNFKLSASGETIILTDNDLNSINQIDFSAQSPDISTGRYPNGTGPFISMQATPGSENINIISINKIELQDIKLYPNPVKDILTLRLENPVKGFTPLQIRTIMGQVVYYEMLDLSTEIQINTQYLKSGVYLLTVKIGNSYLNAKFIKLL